MDLGLQKKAVLVLAGSRGLGKAIAREFAAAKAYVTIASRDGEELAQTANEIQSETGTMIHDQTCDITDPKQIVSVVEATVQRYGTVDVLINNCGGPPIGQFEELDDDAWQQAFTLNLLSYVRAIRAVIPHMRKQQGGHIVNIASSSFKEPISGLVLSNTFRTGVVGLSKTLAHELAPDNILINTVGPGRIETERLVALQQKRSAMLGVSYDTIRAHSQQEIPLGRHGTPVEFAKFVVFLASNANTYITGQAVLVDGGMTKAL